MSRKKKAPKPPIMPDPKAPKYKTRIGFDIGGVISKYPKEMQDMMWMLEGNDSIEGSPFEVYIITDMPRNQAIAMLKENKIHYWNESRLLCGDWAVNGDNCKQVLMKEYQIDIMIDDRLDYILESPAIGLLVVPRPSVGYYAKSWKFPDLKEQRLKELAAELGYDLVKKNDQKALAEFMVSFRETMNYPKMSPSLSATWDAIGTDGRKKISDAVAKMVESKVEFDKKIINGDPNPNFMLKEAIYVVSDGWLVPIDDYVLKLNKDLLLIDIMNRNMLKTIGEEK